MIVYYDKSDGNAVRAVYSHPTQSKAWDAFTCVRVPGDLIPSVEMMHHKVVIRENPEFTAGRASEEAEPYADRGHESVPETLATLKEMTQEEKDAHPIAQPGQPSPTPTEIEVPR